MAKAQGHNVMQPCILHEAQQPWYTAVDFFFDPALFWRQKQNEKNTKMSISLIARVDYTSIDLMRAGVHGGVFSPCSRGLPYADNFLQHSSCHENAPARP